MDPAGLPERPARPAAARNVTDRREAEAALRRRDAILAAEAFVAERLLHASSWEVALPDVIARLGAATGVGRVCVFRNELDERGSLQAVLRHEWVTPGAPAALREAAPRRARSGSRGR